ncbi:PREDICTED: uncharacterized protein LOC106324103 [Brassica oleracea var. oleracea]|uniref:uncharacterized protein LOC106324103 n=1 Tax=Brassica oleracea var. oleracea TaxID=109376 RepID=UPI0006A74D3F|nr:PREDICTED: uncharacterized protein LOC106324103 [Brassica oleracea var. oleracea]
MDNGRSPLWIMRKQFENFAKNAKNARWIMEEVHYYPSTGRCSPIDLGTISIHAMVDGHSRTHAQVKAKMILVKFNGFFSKWVEADSYGSIKDAQVESFVWRNIVCRHGVPYEIVMDNGSQFISTRFEAFCEKWKIRLTKSTPRYPQCNGQAETINKTILDWIKKRLDAKKGRWAEELEGVLWSHRTTPRCATGETPFPLVYGSECMILAEVEFLGVRRRLLPEREDSNNLMLLDELDLIKE